MSQLMDSLEERLQTNFPEAGCILACPTMSCFVNDVDLIITRNVDEVSQWSLTDLLETRCAGDIEATVAAVISDLTQN
jgi:hypothetical protein